MWHHREGPPLQGLSRHLLQHLVELGDRGGSWQCPAQGPSPATVLVLRVGLLLALLVLARRAQKVGPPRLEAHLQKGRGLALQL